VLPVLMLHFELHRTGDHLHISCFGWSPLRSAPLIVIRLQNRTELEKSACCSLVSPKDVRRVLEFGSAQTRFA
jgi:hypothetical protein